MKSNSIKAKRQRRDILTGVLIGFGSGVVTAGLFLISFKEVMQLPYSYFLLLNRESWIDSYNSSVEGRKILKELWTLQQTGADLEAVHAFQNRKEGA